MTRRAGVRWVTMSREISALVRSGVLAKDKWQIIVPQPKAHRLEAMR